MGRGPILQIVSDFVVHPGMLHTLTNYCSSTFKGLQGLLWWNFLGGTIESFCHTQGNDQ